MSMHSSFIFRCLLCTRDRSLHSESIVCRCFLLECVLHHIYAYVCLNGRRARTGVRITDTRYKTMLLHHWTPAERSRRASPGARCLRGLLSESANASAPTAEARYTGGRYAVLADPDDAESPQELDERHSQGSDEGTAAHNSQGDGHRRSPRQHQAPRHPSGGSGPGWAVPGAGDASGTRRPKGGRGRARASSGGDDDDDDEGEGVGDGGAHRIGRSPGRAPGRGEQQLARRSSPLRAPLERSANSTRPMDPGSIRRLEGLGNKLLLSLPPHDLAAAMGAIQMLPYEKQHHPLLQ